MTISVVVATYGEDAWQVMARERAEPSVTEADDVVVVHTPDGTIADARNEGAAAATGDWLVFLDADDQLAPGYLAAMRRAQEQHPGQRALFTPAVQKILKGKPGAPSFWDRGISLREDNWLVLGTMIHKNLFREVGGFSDYPHGFEDWSLWSKCFRVGAEVIKVPDAVYRYFWNPQSKHKQGWRNRRWQQETHQRVARELDEWEAARA